MSESAVEFTGGCHCGAIAVRFETDVDPAELPLRQCGCSFCRRHGATTTTDNEGRLAITIIDASEAVRYRFGAKTADFLLCGRCGVYVAAVMSTDAGAVATLNVNVLVERARFLKAPIPVHYTDETPHQRRLRRADAWTVATVSVLG